jgi:hypothetical protein
MKSWKTTSAGITALIGGLTGLYFAWQANNLSAEIVTACATSIITGIGLIFAKDGNVTGGTIQQ